MDPPPLPPPDSLSGFAACHLPFVHTFFSFPSPFRANSAALILSLCLSLSLFLSARLLSASCLAAFQLVLGLARECTRQGQSAANDNNNTTTNATTVNSTVELHIAH